MTFPGDPSELASQLTSPSRRGLMATCGSHPLPQGEVASLGEPEGFCNP